MGPERVMRVFGAVVSDGTQIARKMLQGEMLQYVMLCAALHNIVRLTRCRPSSMMAAAIVRR
jgi:hypothetical protein